MAAATQTARTSPPNSKMSSPKDSKGALPVVTKTEGELLRCPAQALPSCPVAAALHLPTSRRTRLHLQLQLQLRAHHVILPNTPSWGSHC
jgi:hypothetical protein